MLLCDGGWGSGTRGALQGESFGSPENFLGKILRRLKDGHSLFIGKASFD
jgi:hypothetical protein